MNAPVFIRALDEAEVHFLRLVLDGGFTGPNRARIGRRSVFADQAADLAAMGYLSAVDEGDGVRSYSVTTPGARALVQVGAATVAELAKDADRILDRLTGYRRVIDAGLCDATLCDGWDAFRTNNPYHRVAAAVLVRRGQVEERGPSTADDQTVGRFYLRAVA